MSKKAIILGATGLTGSILLNKLLQDNSYSEVKIFVRKSTGISHQKLSEYIVDVINLEQYASTFEADMVFCCIGTTAKKTPDKALYKKIDYGIPTTAAFLAKQNNINTFIVISALGANANSSIFYNRTKGEMEQQVLKMEIENTYILQPSLILGDRQEKRLGEKIGTVLFKLIKPLMLGGMKKYRAIEAETIAQAMINLAKGSTSNQKVIQSDMIEIIGNKKSH